MKKNGIFMLLLLLILNSIFLPVSATDDVPSETLGETGNIESQVAEIAGLDAPGAIIGTSKLVDNLKAAVVFEANSETMMYCWNPDAPMYPASFVKIMTALVAIENGTLSDEVVVTDSMVGSIPYDAVSIKLTAGERMTLENLLYGLIVGSANDAAVVIAEHVGGAQQKFVDLMNQYAQNIGCTGTTFTNAHGLHDENQHTTARDVAKILNAALKNETFYKIFSTVSVDIPATNKSAMRNLSTGNSLMDKTSRLYYDSRAIGGRTGVTHDGRRCLAAVSKSNGMLLITVVMGAESIYQEDGYSAISVGGYKETSDLLDLCDSKYKAAQIFYPGQILRQMSVIDGENDLAIGPKETLTAVLPKDATVSDLTFRYVDKIFQAPVEKGDIISQAQVWSNGICLAQAEMYAMNSVAVRAIDVEAVDAGFSWRSALVVICVFVVLVACGVFVLKNRFLLQKLIRRFIRKQRKRRQKRR